MHIAGKLLANRLIEHHGHLVEGPQGAMTNASAQVKRTALLAPHGKFPLASGVKNPFWMTDSLTNEV